MRAVSEFAQACMVTSSRAGSDWWQAHRGPGPSCTVHRLQPGCFYMARMRSYTEHDVSYWTREVSVCCLLLQMSATPDAASWQKRIVNTLVSRVELAGFSL